MRAAAERMPLRVFGGALIESRILIIDDDPDLGQAILGVLSTEYKNVTHMDDPEAALGVVTTKSFDLIVCDIWMPKMEGTEFVHRMRDSGVMSPIIFFTGAATKEVYKKAIRLGASDVIEKGSESRELLDTVIRVLEIEHRRHQYYLDLTGRRATEEELEMQKIFLGKLQTAQIKVS